MNAELTPQERFLRGGLIILAILFVGSIGLYVGRGLAGKADYSFVANSATKDGLFLAITLIAVANIRRFGWLTLLVILGHAMLIVSFLTMIIAGETSELTNIEPLVGTATTFVWVWAGVDLLIVLLFWRLYKAALQARYDLRYLSPFQYATVRSLSEVLIKSEGRRLPPEQIARNVDNYLDDFKAAEKGKVKGALALLTVYPLLTGHLPFPAMAPDARLDFVKRRFMTDGAWFGGRIWRKLMQVVIGAAAQLVYLCYYGDQRTFASINYIPYSQRQPEPVEGATEPVEGATNGGLRHRPGVEALEPHDIDCETRDEDVVIVGSGAAGAILAYELAARGRKVLVLERGWHVAPSEFTEDEREMLSSLYADGALQLSRDLRFAVLQGMCVGGSTVVNNAVCIRIQPHVLERWNDPECLSAGLDEDELEESFDHIQKWLMINQQSPNVFSGGAEKFREGAHALELDDHVVEANILDCLGCGYCNIGCKYGRKLSMLDSVLPWAQEEFPGRVEILSQCRAERIETAGNRATAVQCRLTDGRTVRIRAETVIVSAGAINSSLVLQRSMLDSPLAGRHLSFNMATPLTAHFDEKLNSYNGLQISHYLHPPGTEGCVVETWFNPPAMQSLFMPGWFESHYRNMTRYDEMACAGVVVGTRRNGVVRHKWKRGDFAFEPQRDDLVRLVDGLKQLGRIFFEAGATRVMPSTFRYHEFETESDLDELDRYVDDRTGISLNSAHPQGGNAISSRREMGVVDQNFRVHGYENLHVCDASVFPSSITVNPQYTVMALAIYAATRIGGDPPPGAHERAVQNALARVVGVLAPR